MVERSYRWMDGDHGYDDVAADDDGHNIYSIDIDDVTSESISVHPSIHSLVHYQR